MTHLSSLPFLKGCDGSWTKQAEDAREQASRQKDTLMRKSRKGKGRKTKIASTYVNAIADKRTGKRR